MASVMELMRELKHLAALRQAGQISPDQEQRLKDIRAVLDASMPRAPVRSAPPPPQPAPDAHRPEAGHVAGGFDTVGDPNAFQIDLGDALQADLDAAAAKADAAMAAQRRRAPARTPEEAVDQLVDINRTNAYTRPDSYLTDDYFAPDEGCELMPDADVELPLIDPRAVEMEAMQLAMGDVDPNAVMPGGAFLDDFPELYSSGVLVVDAPEEDAGADSADPNLLVPGKRRVTVHMTNGEVKRGVIHKLARNDGGFTLHPQGAGKSEPISLVQVKAIFITANPGASPTPPQGRNVTVVFKDRRSVQGATADLGLGPAFTLWPPAGRGGMERIIINQAECLEVR